MPQKKRTEYADHGTTETPANDIAQILNAVNSWAMPEVENDAEIEKRTNEYFNLCVSKGELPMFETYCLYLGIPDDLGKKWANGEECTKKRSRLIQLALTRMKASEGKAVMGNKIPYVPYIWRSKQYFNYREPASKLEEILAGNVLKELPSASSVAAAYLADVEDEEEDQEATEDS